MHAAKAFVLPYIPRSPPLTTTVPLCFSLMLSFCAFQLFICLHRAFASDTVGTEQEKNQQRHSLFFFLPARLLPAWWWQVVPCFSLSLSLSLPNKTSAALCQLWAWATLQKHCCLRKWSGIEEKVLLRLRVKACFLFPLRTCYWSLCSSSFWVYAC